MISIITVVLNMKDGLERTVRSVAGQTYSDIEFVVIDGGSTDGTLDLIKKYEDKISYWSNEKDEGIYDAMNKGLRKAKGDYVWFLNAGDEIYAPGTLERILAMGEADAYYGEIEYVDETGKSFGTRTLKKPPENLSWKNFIEGMVVGHQGIIMKRECAVEYNPEYKHCADIDWAIRSFKKCGKALNTHLILAKFLIGGYSKRNITRSNKERYRILREHFPFWKVWMVHVKLGARFLRYYFSHKKRLY